MNIVCTCDTLPHAACLHCSYDVTAICSLVKHVACVNQSLYYYFETILF